MTVKTYSLAKEGDRQLSANFTLREFRCKDNSDRVLVDEDLIILLQEIRSHFAVPVTINSAYRTAAYNKAVGGAAASQHLLGTAADIVVSGVMPLAVAQYAEFLGAGGIGLYSSFVHVDTRATMTRWDQRSGRQINVGGFPGYAPATPADTSATDTATISVLLYSAAGQLLDTVPGQRIDGQVFAHTRRLFAPYGYTVLWDDQLKSVIIHPPCTTTSLDDDSVVTDHPGA